MNADLEQEAARAAGDLVFHYDGAKYLLETEAAFIPMDQRSVARQLRGRKLSGDDIDAELNRIQVDRFVSYAGALAGHGKGVHEYGGKRLLATSSPKIIQPAKGDWSTLRAVIDGLLGGDPSAGELQVETFLGWLKVSHEALVSGKRRPGQCAVIAGEPGSGKSLLIDITEQVLGGRRANPYPHFSGRTAFNGDLAGAELLAVDDEAGSTDIRSRRHLAASIKAYLFSGSVRIEGKHREGFNFRPVWRMMMACNHEAENLLVIPPLTDDIADKLTLFHCHKRPLPMRAHTLEERERFFAKLCDEVPAMLAWLNEWEIPAHLTDERCGVRHYHHPDLVAALGELAPETALLSLVDALADAGRLLLPWTGTARDLKAVLVGDSSTSRDAEKLLGGWLNATGAYLGKLVGDRVEKIAIRRGDQHWRIRPRPSEGGMVE